ncbi:MAG: phenylalanine--tRNA ligase subunit beta [Mesosutterella multiformis]|jgi:phenylalanyl-tRNA synthetase beta chain|nr:phenylalanine--tRNA ligase subunit beta [Sutterella sp.]MCH3935436.1 phenylalanine--tRNA ligase subunit beta [Mesosutterella sp.]MCH3937653.1 phenylalanine--tRNA ligase subunit beta [Mesosutterella sp.]MCI1638219.1 phenylalanine--tRNA ligase subunit beta [Mesosutterella multiformis]
MLFSESWLRTYVNPAISSEELQDALTMHGLEVDEARKAAPDFTGVVIAEVVECRDHENSDHLHVCQVNAGTGELIQIVCGAPNVRAGVRVPCAMVGAELPGGFKIKKAKLRGVPSNGMLCSARELGVSEDHDGLWLLPEDAPIGEDIRKYAHLDDVVVDLNVTPNRGDALSLTGIAREVHAVTGAELKLPEIHEAAVTTDAAHAVKIEASDLCARYTSRVITGLNAKAKTPEWMAERLERCGQRPISALVDISNYVLLELGRPTHFFDLDKLSGTVTARWAKEGEKIELLNGKTVDLTPYYGVIADDNGSQAIAGIMGGSADSVSDDTVNLFIESAFFRPAAIQGRARKLNFSSDSSFRFERGVDYGTTREHLEYITALVLSICGTDATRVGPVSDIESDLPERRVVKFRAARCRKLVGVDIPTDFMEEAFKRLGFEYTRDGDLFTVTSPTYRFDIEIEEDLVEEVARLWGYDKLPENPPLERAVMLPSREDRRTQHDLRLKLAGRGYQELVNFSFVEEKWEKDFGGEAAPIRLLNPIASQLSVMRTQLIGGLVDILRYNLNRKEDRVRVFELGRVFFQDPTIEPSDTSVKGVRQPEHLAGLAYGTADAPQWGIKSRRVDFFDVKGDLERLAFPLTLDFVPEVFPSLHPGRSAGVYLDGKRIGLIGELHPRLQQAYDLPLCPVVFEIDVEPLLSVPVPEHKPVSKFQKSLRDISLAVPASVTSKQIFDAVRAARRTDVRLACLTDFRLFDVYHPENQPSADKSMAFRLVLESFGEEAVTEAQIEGATEAVIAGLEPLGIKLRA